MANIRKMEPSRLVRHDDLFQSPFDDFFRGLFVHPMRFGSLSDQSQFCVDIEEDEKAFRVSAELPGVRKEDINVTIDGDELGISAEMKRETKCKTGTALHTERYTGRMYRSFSLGHEIDQSKAQAKYVDGVLELTLPKTESEQSRRKQIAVH